MDRKESESSTDMAFRSLNPQNLHNYPKIHIDRGSVIKPCITDQSAADQFLDKPASSWKKIAHDLWQEGVPFLLKCVANINTPANSNTYHSYLIRFIKYIAFLMLHIHRVYLYIYGYFYPYSLMTLDEVCNEFSRCPKWTESVIRAFAWHPNHDRCALAICNDYIYVYQGANRIRVLRHNHQRKILDLAWQPTNKDVLVVATQTNIIIWRIQDINEGPLGVRDHSRNSNLTYLAPGLHLLKRDKESHLNGSTRHDSSNNLIDKSVNLPCGSNSKIIDSVLAAPIVSIAFDHGGSKLYACSPNSSKIAVLDIDSLLQLSDGNSEKNDLHIEYIRRYGQGVTKLCWSPEKSRLASATTSLFIRVFEPFKWSCKKWAIPGSVVQDIVWSRPEGRMLLVANKSEPIIYALPFLDSPKAKDVGGNKSMMKALDLTPTTTELGDVVGGRVQSFAWDKNGKRLAISFKDNPETILLYRTIERPTLEFHQMGVIKSDNSSFPLLMDFHDKFRNGSMLTICWSDGSVQHIPLEESRIAFNDEPRSPQPRSLTSFCNVSGNTSLTKTQNFGRKSRPGDVFENK